MPSAARNILLLATRFLALLGMTAWSSMRARRFHALFQPKMAQEAHESYVLF
jgi:hypothetical protein